MVALLPAHDEDQVLPSAIQALGNQTRPPDRILVVSDNSADGTVAVGRGAGVVVVETMGNTDKKAVALSQALAVHRGIGSTAEATEP